MSRKKSPSKTTNYRQGAKAQSRVHAKTRPASKIEIVKRYVFYFFVVALIGWLAEILAVFLMSGVIINAGVLIGPWVPIYAWAALLIIFIGRRVKNNWQLFGIIMVISGMIEYFTSIWLENQHHARWWDYSSLPLNVDGRICLWVLAIFSVIGVFCVRILVPMLDQLYDKIHGQLLDIVLIILVISFAADWIHSVSYPNKTPGMPYNNSGAPVHRPRH